MSLTSSWGIEQKKTRSLFQLQEASEIIHCGFSTRHVTSSKIYEEFSQEPALGHYVISEQVHSPRLAEITERDLSLERRITVPQCDALMTSLPDVALTVRTADCLPIFVIMPRKPVVLGLVHAGWKGTQQGIVLKTLERFKELSGVDFKQIKILFGPALRACCYEVGPEFKDAFTSEVLQTRGDKLYFDLIEANRRELLSQGILSEHIHDTGICTACSNADYFSYRKERQNSDRMVSWIYKKTL